MVHFILIYHLDSNMMISLLLALSFVHCIHGCRNEEPEIPSEVDPCDSVKCVRGWCEAYYNSTTCVCHDGFWGYLCEHEGSTASSLFWDFLPLQEEAFLTGRINSEEEAVHPLCQVGSFPGPQHKRRARRNTKRSADNGKRRWTDAQSA
ncbi:uncharacterized protein LOC128165850 [Crassostrea angulata]|uniref:uncharacterized protein LOC128165850 n=1 Tax=Magallana angulata TaxID=2784310 RepID=UPI0022B18123|nr:uncharacterized protein LOC128165850 [Crassostrea angulata]